MKWKFADYMSEPGHCPLAALNATLRFFGIGKKFAWARLPSAAHTLNHTLQSLSGADAIVLNLGVHWGQSCHAKYRGSNNDYARELASLEPVLASDLFVRPCRKGEEVRSARNLLSARPLLVWKETSPQHFPTSNGLFPEGQRFHGEDD
jgi:hypothetical protein